MKMCAIRFLPNCAIAVLLWTARCNAETLNPSLAVNEGKSFGLIEIHLPMEKNYANPFDPDEVSIQGHLQSADGSTIVADGFANRDYTMSHGANDAWDHLKVKGDPYWAIRLSPPKAGNYSWWVTRTDSSGEASSAKHTVEIKADPAAKGFIRVAGNHTNFEFDDGSAFYPIGMDIAWQTKGGMYDYDRWLEEFSSNGGNQIRVFAILPGSPLERIKVPAGGAFDKNPAGHLSYVSGSVFPDLNERTQFGKNDPDGGLGRIDLASAWRYDYMLGLAKRYGIHIQLCLNGLSEFSTAGFAWNPYNKLNGGMLEKPYDIFTNADARKYMKRRLRYVVARYGWSTNVLSWELFNEVDDFSHSVAYPDKESEVWHREMSQYLKEIDPNKHLVTSSFAKDPPKDICDLPQIDFTQDHTYNIEDTVPAVSIINARRTAEYGKPHLFGEFGLEFLQQRWGGGRFTDPTGVELETAYWAGLASPGAGTVWPWYWENYVEPNQLFPLTKPVAEFARDIPWNKLKWTPLHVPKITYVVAANASEFQTLKTTPVFWHGMNDMGMKAETFRVGNDGTFDPPAEDMAWMLAPPGRNGADSVTFETNYPIDGRFEVEVTVVGKKGATLEIALDGKSAFSKDFPAATGTQPFLFKYTATYSIDVPAGQHVISVVNTGKDSLAVHYVWTHYLSADATRLRFCGMLGDDTLAIVYLYNQDYTWWHIDQHETPTPIPASRFTIPGLKAGRYDVETWSPSEGKILSRTQANCGAEGLTVSLPEVTNDVALKIRLAVQNGGVKDH